MVSSLSEAGRVFIAGALTCLAVGRIIIPWLSRARWTAPVRYEDCPPLLAYQKTKTLTPTMGGVFVLGSGMLIAAAAGGLRSLDGWLVLGAVGGLGLLGLWDDWLKFRKPNAVGVRAVPKLLVALLVGAAVGYGSLAAVPDAAVLEIPWSRQQLDLGWGWVPFAMVVIAGSAHAVNLTDGMDGLAAGCAALVLAVLGCWLLGQDVAHRTLLPWCASLAGACIGFLWFNSFPASVFLGDVGALGLGAALGAIALLTHAALWLLIVGGVFVAEALSVILQVASYKWRNKRRIFRVAPLHHHVHLGGITEPKVIIRFWVVGLILAALGLTRSAVP